MIQRLVSFALRAPYVVIMAAVGLLIGGLLAYRELNVEAYPNPVPPLVEIIAQPDGMSAEDVERYVTVPLESSLSGIAGIDHIRSQSLFGLTDVKCYFKWGTDYQIARQEVINRIQVAQLPDGVKPSLSPANAIGEMFRYELRGKGYTTQELKSVEDWVLERQFKQVQGVIDVVSFGGETRQYQVGVDPFRLRGQNVTLVQLMTAIQNANKNVGGQRLTVGEQAYTIRGIGLIKTVHDIDDIVIAARNGVPVRVRDVATSEIGSAPRLGIVGHDDNPDIVQGVVLMRYGGQTAKVLKGIHERIELIRDNHLLPPGMEIVPYYDRGDLVKLTTHTVIENLIVGMCLVGLILWLFLGHTRAALITALNIPLALMVAFSGLVLAGTSANLISLGAIDFGIVVDSTVIMMESIFRFFGSHGAGSTRERIEAGAREVAVPMSFSTMIIGVAFLPLFTMTGVAGVIFSPMATTYAFAIGGAICLALTLTPALASKVIPADAEEKDSFLMRAIQKVDVPYIRYATKHPRRSLTIGLLGATIGLAFFLGLGGEFMPKLEEGNLWVRASLPTSISLEKSSSYVGRMRSILRGCPEKGECTNENRKYPFVETVVSQLGRPDDGTDVAGFQNIELFAALRPFSEWPRGMTKEKLTKELSTQLEDTFPGVIFNFSQMIGDNVEEALSGVKGENSIKVFGPDVSQNEKHAEEIQTALEQVPGVADLGVIRSSGQPSVTIVPDRQACARYGLNTGDVEAVIEAAIGGKAVTQVYEGERKFDLVVRWLSPYRASLEAIREITVATPEGSNVPLGQLSKKITVSDSASVVFREDGQRYIPLKFSVRGRDLASTVKEAQAKIASTVKLPYDMHLEWSGTLGELKNAQGRLVVIVPLTLLIIVLLIFASVRNWTDTLIVCMNIPVACSGGVVLLFLCGIPFSISAAMGFISIFGISVQHAILIVTQFQRLRDTHHGSIEEAAFLANERRVRPVLMTTLGSFFGLLPAALSNGIGSQTQKPLALVVIGGAFVLAVFARFIIVAALVVLHRRNDRRVAARRSITPPAVA